MSGDPVHLGAGAYAWHDGYQFWISANSPGSHERVALDPSVLQAFFRYIERIEGVKITVERAERADPH